MGWPVIASTRVPLISKWPCCAAKACVLAAETIFCCAETAQCSARSNTELTSTRFISLSRVDHVQTDAGGGIRADRHMHCARCKLGQQFGIGTVCRLVRIERINPVRSRRQGSGIVVRRVADSELRL